MRPLRPDPAGAGGLYYSNGISADNGPLWGDYAHIIPAHDGRGNIIGLGRLNLGELWAQFEYDPYGRTVSEKFYPGASAHVPKIPFRYNTRLTDRETGHIYYRFRHYSPHLGRWLNRDPIGEAGGLNLFGMVGNDPVNQMDPLGLSILSRFAAWRVGIEHTPEFAAENDAAVADGLLAHPRLFGGVQLAGGVLGCSIGAASIAAPEPTGASKVLGWSAFILGYDNAVAGARTIWDGQIAQTFASQAVEASHRACGASEQDAYAAGENFNMLASFFTTAGAQWQVMKAHFSQAGIITREAEALKAAEAARTAVAAAPKQPPPPTSSSKPATPVCTESPPPASSATPVAAEKRLFGRVSHPKGFREQVWERAKSPDGNVYDPNGRILKFDEPWELGHLPDHKFSDAQIRAANEGWARETWIRYQNDPDIYRPELPSSNAGHQWEIPEVEWIP